MLRSQAIQDIIERIDKDYQRFFQSLQDHKAHNTIQTISLLTFRAIRQAKSFTLKQAVWKLQRDYNAAINIFWEVASSLGGGHVRLVAASNGC